MTNVTVNGTAYKDVQKVLLKKTDEDGYAEFSEGNGSGGGGVVVTELTAPDANMDMAMWLNTQNIKLVKGINMIELVEAVCYSTTAYTPAQGELTSIYLAWDGETISNQGISVNTGNAKSHLRGYKQIQSNYATYGATNDLLTGHTTAVSVAEDGTLTLTTSATEVTTGNYNNPYILAGANYRLVQIANDVVC